MSQQEHHKSKGLYLTSGLIFSLQNLHGQTLWQGKNIVKI
ncbi:hypothetical protein SPONN_1216 [uncultured Candidatus Thioglobus sp.]|nr:hypothetical protein SPONN_1216 [uncultured Candidatus Thioglobus sp.]